MKNLTVIFIFVKNLILLMKAGFKKTPTFKILVSANFLTDVAIPC